MKKVVAIPKLKPHERLLLSELYNLNYEGTQFEYKHVWLKLQARLPRDFRPENMSNLIISPDGEKIQVLGVMALQRNRSVARKIDKIIYAIRDALFADINIDKIDLEEISKKVELPFKEVMFLFILVNDYKHFHTGSGEQMGKGHYKTILFGGRNMQPYYNFKGYEGIENLLLHQSLKETVTVDEYFTENEVIMINNKLDLFIDHVLKNSAADMEFQKEVREDLAEMKSLTLVLSKKNWIQTIWGKLAIKGIEKAVFEPALVKLFELVKPIFKHFLP